MINYPDINPIALQIGLIKIYWYGITYLIAFAIAWILGRYRAKKSQFISKSQLDDLIFYCAIGAVLGGRIGYTIFYNLPNFIHDPLIIFKTWEGGMSFHGGLLGVICALILFVKKFKLNYWQVQDFLAPLVPLGLGAGRIGNFINGELWGRATNLPWGMIFPSGGNIVRHPSQLYEFFLEGILLFIVLWLYSAKPKPRRAISAMFLICYGSFRFVVEFLRNPDPQLGFIAFNWLTMGQLLSTMMIIAGATIIFFAYRNKK